MKKVVLAYSGGLDTSACIPWLQDKGYEVIAYMADVGQNKDIKPAVKRAKQAGVKKIIVSDLKQEFIRDFIWPSIKANAMYENRYLLATSLARPLIAKEWVRVAHAEGATAVAHGCTGKGNDQVRFEVTAQILDSKLEIIAPVREWELKSRDEEIDYVKARGIDINVTKKSPYSLDENLWGVSIESGVLEDPWHEPPADCYVWTRGAETRNPAPRSLVIDFVKGVPVGINGKRMEGEKLIRSLNATGALYGIGRTDMIENRLVGIKSREVYEAPAGQMLVAAHRDLESLVLDRAMTQYKDQVTLIYGRMIYEGLWFTDLKKALDGFINVSQQRVTGSVRLKLEKGRFTITGRKSPNSLYKEKLATYSAKDEFDQRLAKGFIDLFALPYKR